MDDVVACPVCGVQSYVEKIRIDGGGPFATFMDGFRHCPNEDQPDHVEAAQSVGR